MAATKLAGSRGKCEPVVAAPRSRRAKDPLFALVSCCRDVPMVSATTPAGATGTSQPSSSQYFETEDKLIISIDIGNAACELALECVWSSAGSH